MRAWRDFFECWRWHSPLCCRAHSAVAGWGSSLPNAHSLTLFCHLQFWAAHAERTLRGFTPYCCWLASPYCCLCAPSKSPSFMRVLCQCFPFLLLQEAKPCGKVYPVLLFFFPHISRPLSAQFAVIKDLVPV